MKKSDIRFPDSPNLCVHQIFELQVERSPQSTAVIFENTQLTYQELNQRANQLAHYLRRLGVKPEIPVGIYLERCLEMVIGLLGILKAGGSYVPLDPTYPPDRLAFILEDTQTPVILTQEKCIASLPIHQAKVISLDSDWEEIAKNSLENPLGGATSDNLIYTIYTSGSTGRPKGVMIPHQGISNQILWRQTTFGLTPADKVLQNISFSFDPSVWQIFWPLTSGAKLVLAHQDGNKDANYLVRLIVEQQITVIAVVPAILRVLLEEPGIENCQGLKHITCGGEALPTELIKQFFTRLNLDNVLYNCYGPTETSIDATFWSCQPQTSLSIAPIGSPITNTEIYILDENLQPVPVGETGELHIGGVGLARGYLNLPELTAEKFIPHPFSQVAGKRLYKTGDLGRYLPDGNIEFLGRIDSQVKIRGFRIELGEIESALSQHPDLAQAVVIADESSTGDQQLVAYFVSHDQPVPTAKDLQQFLSQNLPSHMVPQVFISLGSLPLMPNGKVDRRALPYTIHHTPTLIVSPRNPLEETLASIWVEVLGLEKVSIYDNFFELGGHSLLATRVVSKCSQTFGVRISLEQLFASPTIARLAIAIGQILQHQGANSSTYEIIPRQNLPSAPLSFAQQRLWFLHQLEPDRSDYHIHKIFRLSGVLHIGALQQAIDTIITHQEILRTTYINSNGNPIQVIGNPKSAKLQLINLTDYPAVELDQEVERLLQQEIQRPFNLSQDLMLRGTLIQTAANKYILMLVIHHIAFDGWSVSILAQQLSQLYKSFSTGDTVSLKELPIQYTDFAIWQREWLQGNILDAPTTYWRQQLAGAPPLLSLPTDRPRPAVQTFRGSSQSFVLPEELTTELKLLSRREGVTLFMTLLAAFNTLLYRYTDSEDILVGAPIANRSRTELEGLIGFFVNTIVLRTNISDQPSFQELLRRTRKVAISAFSYPDLPFEKLVEELQPQRDLSYSPIFQVMFAFYEEYGYTQNIQFPGLTTSPMDVHENAAQFDLTLSLEQSSTGLIGKWEYSTDLFDRRTIERMNGHFQVLLASIVANPAQSVAELPMLTADEKHQLLVEWNNTEIPYPQDKCIHQLFEEQVERTPNAIAAVFQQSQLTYQQLNQRANQLAHYLQIQGVAADVLVGIYLERSLEMLIGLLAVLKAGGAYVPLEPSYPRERLAQIISDTGMSLLLTQHSLLASLPINQANIICIDTDWTIVAEHSQANCLSGVTPENLSYIIYTSGSTGKPKGVQISHSSVVNLLISLNTCPGFTASDVFNSVTTICFDVSVVDLYLTLMVGAKLIIVPQEISIDGKWLLSQLQESGATVMLATPATCQILLAVSSSTEDLLGIKLICAGEALPAQLAGQLRARGAQLWNFYGPTETTVYATAYQVGENPQYRSDQTATISIGRPIANTQTYILDRYLQPVPIGVPGELHIGGIGLSRGYLNRPELTAEKFIDHPFKNGQKVYKTGDLVRYLPDGNIDYIGRIDRQVKIRGFRIELGEIENVLGKHPSITQVVVIAHEKTIGDRRLVAYIVCHQENILTIEELRQFLTQKLPSYMVPTTFIFLESLPVTPNGKVDRLALPYTLHPTCDTLPVTPANSLELVLVDIWKQILGLERISVQDNFFELGGHSILAVQLIAEIDKRLAINLPLATLFTAQTVEQMAAVLTKAEKSAAWSSLVSIQPHGSQPPFFCIHGLGGEVLCFRDLALHLGSDQPFYGIQPVGLDGKTSPYTTVEEMASHYIQEIRATGTRSPYFLGGYSFGGIVAFEMAKQLLQQQEEIGKLVIFDTCLPGYEWRSPIWKRIFLHLGNIFTQGPTYLRQKIRGWSQQIKYQHQNRYRRYLAEVSSLPATDKHLEMIGINDQAARNYQLLPYPGRITLIRTEDQHRDNSVGQQYISHFGWSDLAQGGLDIHYVPGSHISLFDEPHVEIMAAKLRACLQM